VISKSAAGASCLSIQQHPGYKVVHPGHQRDLQRDCAHATGVQRHADTSTRGRQAQGAFAISSSPGTRTCLSSWTCARTTARYALVLLLSIFLLVSLVLFWTFLDLRNHSKVGLPFQSWTVTSDLAGPWIPDLFMNVPLQYITVLWLMPVVYPAGRARVPRDPLLPGSGSRTCW